MSVDLTLWEVWPIKAFIGAINTISTEPKAWNGCNSSAESWWGCWSIRWVSQMLRFLPQPIPMWTQTEKVMSRESAEKKRLRCSVEFGTWPLKPLTNDPEKYKENKGATETKNLRDVRLTSKEIKNKANEDPKGGPDGQNQENSKRRKVGKYEAQKLLIIRAVTFKKWNQNREIQENRIKTSEAKNYGWITKV